MILEIVHGDDPKLGLDLELTVANIPDEATRGRLTDALIAAFQKIDPPDDRTVTRDARR